MGKELAGRYKIDSRLVCPGDIFVATSSKGSPFYRGVFDYPGTHSFDSRPYVNDAIARGATVVVTSDSNLVSTAGGSVEVVLADGIGYLGEQMKREIERSGKHVIGVTGSTGKSTLCEMIRVALGKSTYKHLSDRPTPISVPLKALNNENFYEARNIVIEMPMDSLGQWPWPT